MSEWDPVVVEDHELKHNLRTEHIPVFILKDKGMINGLDRIFEIGAEDYIRKSSNLNN